MGKKPTIQMIAELAGVSRGTVDRVLNNRSYVKEDVKERILRIVQEVGYVSPREIHLREGAAQVRPLRLGVLLPNFGHQFQEEVQKGIEKARLELEDANVEVVVKRCNTELPGEAIGLLKELEEAGVEGISVCAVKDGEIVDVLAGMKEKGIPSITFNSDLPGSGRLFFVGQNIKKTGRIAAELITKCVRPGEKLLAAVGNKKFDGHYQRLAGFQERLEELGFPMEHLLTAETFNDYSTTVEVVEEALRENPELTGIYMANLSVAGCAQAVRAQGRQGRVHVVCHDVNEGIRQLLQEGLVDFTIPQDFVYQGYEPLMILTNYLRKGICPEEGSIGDCIQVICAENV